MVISDIVVDICRVDAIVYNVVGLFLGTFVILCMTCAYYIVVKEAIAYIYASLGSYIITLFIMLYSVFASVVFVVFYALRFYRATQLC